MNKIQNELARKLKKLAWFIGYKEGQDFHIANGDRSSSDKKVGEKEVLISFISTSEGLDSNAKARNFLDQTKKWDTRVIGYTVVSSNCWRIDSVYEVQTFTEIMNSLGIKTLNRKNPASIAYDTISNKEGLRNISITGTAGTKEKNDARNTVVAKLKKEGHDVIISPKSVVSFLVKDKGFLPPIEKEENKKTRKKSNKSSSSKPGLKKKEILNQNKENAYKMISDGNKMIAEGHKTVAMGYEVLSKMKG